ncbi:hypothetical protein MKX41_30410 [Paenibacillus sp. FSL R5-0475]|uniref:hypothetical protein n=1 Tax=Paenibacillus sp. FSL R5-0475 TaxID=2921643 RepID=UPI0030F506A3
MNKDEYFENLEEIITDQLYIGSSESDIQKEIETNMWRITIQPDLVKENLIDDFDNFINKVIENRQEQIDRSNSANGMIFYLWFDLMASQLRFNLISDVNKALPFACSIQYTGDKKEVLEDFINSSLHNGLPIEGYDDNFVEKEFVLKIYKKHLRRKII